jgi:transcriptional regulator
MSVPTWNFMAVHAYGVVRFLSEDELEQVLHQLVDENEETSSPWKLELTQMMRERMLGAIVGFEIRLHRIEGKFKLSQNQSRQDRLSVISQLAQSEHGKDIAYRMSKALEKE